MLSTVTKPLLQNGKNLLAFSSGVDSTALFFLLHENHITFDLAIVNYRMRAQAAEEVAYARALAKKFDKECFVMEVELGGQNFEAEARTVRYDFFETLINQHGYTNLITAHQLDDRLEWLLMQLSKGAGLYELLGAQTIEARENYRLVRPLLETTKSELLNYLNDHSIHYFEDDSNSDEKYKRNFFRHNLATPLLERYAKGIKKSFAYLNEDLRELLEQNLDVGHVAQLHYFKTPPSRRSAIIVIDRILKENGFLMRQGDKEALKNTDEHVVGRQYIVSFHPHYTFLAPYHSVEMPKVFKEKCRLLRIPRKLRSYLFTNEEAFDVVVALLNNSRTFE